MPHTKQKVHLQCTKKMYIDISYFITQEFWDDSSLFSA